MSVERVTRRDKRVRYRVRWREHGRNRAETFDRLRDAQVFDGEVRRRHQLGTLGMLDAGEETLDHYVATTWTPSHTAHLAPRTIELYAYLYDLHISPQLGPIPLRELTAERIARWQAERLSAGAGPSAVRKALTLLGGILQRAAEAQRIPSNPARYVRKSPLPQTQEVRPLAPATVERMRAALGRRDATLIAVLAYAGLRPGEALTLRWGHVRDRTLIVNAPKTRSRRSVRLLAPLASDLAEWRMASGRPGDNVLVFPGHDGDVWGRAAYLSWGRRAFRRAAEAASAPDATPYALRHSFCSLLLAEGRSVIYVARQLGHNATLTLNTYGHVIDELDSGNRIDAEATIRAARAAVVPASYPRAVEAGT